MLKKVYLTIILSRVKAIKLTRLNRLICIQRKTVFWLMMSNFEIRCNFNITSTCHGYFMRIKGLETVEQRRCGKRNKNLVLNQYRADDPCVSSWLTKSQSSKRQL